MVFYTGNKPWNAPCSIWDMCQDNSALMQTIWQTPFYLVELNKIEEESLKTRLRSGTMEFVMRYQFREHLVKEIQKIAQNFQQLVLENDDHFLLQLLQYILAVDDEHRSINELINQLHDKLPPSVEEKIMGLAERIYTDGQEKGIQQGIQQGKFEKEREIATRLFEEGAALDFVAKVTGLSLTQLKVLQKH